MNTGMTSRAVEGNDDHHRSVGIVWEAIVVHNTSCLLAARWLATILAEIEHQTLPQCDDWCVARSSVMNLQILARCLPITGWGGAAGVTEPPNYDGPHVPVIVIMTSDSRTYVPHNLKGLLSSEQDPITGVLQYYNSLFKIFNRVK
jgi:hypothetical protein